MTLNIRNRIAGLLIVLAVMLFVVTDVAIAAKCEDSYYYASYNYNEKHYKTVKFLAFDMYVFDAQIYDIPKMPSSWVYVIDNNSYYDRGITHITAAAKSDKHTIGFKDLQNFVILRQPKDISEEEITIIFNFIYVKKEGGIGTNSAMLDRLDNHQLTVEKIDKCLPKKLRRH
ncbi:MAG: hypothetical protein H7843_06950 [Nitrospirota bacterium]